MSSTTVSRIGTILRQRRAPARAAVIPIIGILAMLGPAIGRANAEPLKDVIELALSHDATIQSAAAEVRAARLEAAAAARSVFPSLNLGAAYQYTTATADLTLPIPGAPQTVSLVQPNTIDTSVGVRWAPFTGFARKSTIELKRLSSLLAENSLSSTRTQVAINVVTAYRQAQAANLRIDSLASGRKRTELQLERTQALLAQGMAKEVDALSLKISLLDFDQQLIAARASLKDALDQLRSLTGREISVTAAPAADSAITIPALDLESLDQIKALGIRRGVLQAQKTLDESKYYPTLSLSGTVHYGLPGADPVANEWMLYATAGVGLSWSYDWGATTLSAKAATQRLEGLSSDETAARQKLTLAYEKAVRDWKAMKEEAAALKASLDLAHTRMSIVKSQYDQGMASTTDFTDANLQLTVAELRYRSQILSLILKANQIDALSGEPITSWSVSQ